MAKSKKNEKKARGSTTRPGKGRKGRDAKSPAKAALSKSVATEAASAGDPCDDGSPEKEVSTIPVPSGSVVRLRIVLCGSPAAVAADLEGNRFLPPPAVIKDDFVTTVPVPTAAGDYFLLWVLKPTAKKWSLQTEVSVNGAVHFRLRKNAQTSSFPAPKFAVFLRVP